MDTKKKIQDLKKNDWSKKYFLSKIENFFLIIYTKKQEATMGLFFFFFLFLFFYLNIQIVFFF